MRPTCIVTDATADLSTSVHNNEDNNNDQEVRLIALLSPRGTTAKGIVMNPSQYVVQPDDIVAETWVSNETIR